MSDWDDGFETKFCILNEKLIYIENWKLNIADKWLIPIPHVTYVYAH